MERSRRTAGYFGMVAVVGLALGVGGTLSVRAQPKMTPAEKAQCGPGSRPESGLQGTMTSAERFSAPRAYNCNLELVGQEVAEGTSWGGAAVDVCAFVGRNKGPIDGKGGPSPKRAGAVVVDVADPRRTRITAYLDAPGMLEANESMAASAERKLLAGVDPYYVYEDARTASRSDSDFAVYDVSNCRQPVLKGSLKLSHVRSHGGYFAADGRTFWLTSFSGNIGMGGDPVDPKNPNTEAQANDKWRSGTKTDALVGIDVSDPTRPREVVRWVIPAEVGAAHHLSISLDGNRAYLNLFPRQYGAPSTIPNAVGVVTLDISEVQERKPNPQVRVLARTIWEGGGLQGSMEFKVKGRPYLHADTRIFDVSDPRNPRQVSWLMHESELPSSRAQLKTKDPSAVAGGGPTFCAIDDPNDAKLFACGFGSSGVRVFDLRDPSRPREVAYYKPPSTTGAPLPGSYANLRWAQQVPGRQGEGPRPDNTPRAIAVLRQRGEVWFMSHEAGFQVVRFTDWFKKAEPNLF